MKSVKIGKSVFTLADDADPKPYVDFTMKLIERNRRIYMSLQKQIELDMRVAMKNKDKKTNLLKYFVAEFSRRPNLNVDLTDDEVISLIKKYIKSIEETIKLTNKTTEEQLFEIKVLSRYLPKQASEEEIKEWISSNIELPENPNARLKYMKDIMKHFGSSVDGNTVKNILMSM